MVSIFIGGPLDGKEDYILPPDTKSPLRVPWQDHYPGHPEHAYGYYVYRFDGLAWRYERSVTQGHPNRDSEHGG